MTLQSRSWSVITYLHIFVQSHFTSCSTSPSTHHLFHTLHAYTTYQNTCYDPLTITLKSSYLLSCGKTLAPLLTFQGVNTGIIYVHGVNIDIIYSLIVKYQHHLLSASKISASFTFYFHGIRSLHNLLSGDRYQNPLLSGDKTLISFIFRG